MTSIKDIARLSGVAPSTVSRYLNQSGYVAKETGKKIQTIIDQVDYSPNQTARELSHGKTHRIGVIVPHTKHPYFLDIIRGLMDAALSSQDQLLLLPSAYNADIEMSYLKQLKSKAFDSLIISSHSLPLQDIEAYSSYGKIVLLEPCQSSQVSSISVQRKKGLDDLFRVIAQTKIKKMALLFTRNSEKSSTYQETIKSLKKIIPKDIEFQTFGNIANFEDGYQIGSELLKHSVELVLANSDDVASGLASFYNEHDKTLPLLFSQDSQLSGKLLNIPSIDNQRYHLGKKAFQLAVSNDIEHLQIKSNFIKNRK
ncbi:LacI family DNA-binding transcriptional regulator [Streptococcus hongkongensis]|nr:hypothetical protein NC01_03070 [Streptococcus uberis]